MVECRAFVYRAKINEANDSTPTHPFLRINFMNSVKETQVCLYCFYSQVISEFDVVNSN